MNTLLIGVLLANVFIAAVLVVTVLQVRTVYRRISSQFTSFISSPAEGKPSPLAETTQAIGENLARSIAVQLKTTFMGMESGNARAEAALQGDIARDAIDQKSPMVGALLTMFPRASKRLLKNPGLIDIALGMIGKVGQIPGTSPGNNHSPETSGQVKFKL